MRNLIVFGFWRDDFVSFLRVDFSHMHRHTTHYTQMNVKSSHCRMEIRRVNV